MEGSLFFWKHLKATLCIHKHSATLEARRSRWGVRVTALQQPRRWHLVEGGMCNLPAALTFDLITSGWWHYKFSSSCTHWVSIWLTASALNSCDSPVAPASSAPVSFLYLGFNMGVSGRSERGGMWSSHTASRASNNLKVINMLCFCFHSGLEAEAEGETGTGAGRHCDLAQSWNSAWGKTPRWLVAPCSRTRQVSSQLLQNDGVKSPCTTRASVVSWEIREESLLQQTSWYHLSTKSR